MINKFSLKIGDLLFKNAFPIYNVIYKIFKQRSDRSEIQFIKKVIRPGNTVIDIGGNIGFYTRLFSELVGSDGLVITFEPDQINFEHLVQNTKSLTNIQLINKAVSFHSQGVSLYKSNTLNVDHRTYSHDDSDSSIHIDSISIDEFLQDQPVDFIKMDIQGYEMSALQGMEQTLLKHSPVVLMEYWPYGLITAGRAPLEIFTYVESLGYDYFQLNDGDFGPIRFDIQSSLSWPAEKYINLYLSKSP